MDKRYRSLTLNNSVSPAGDKIQEGKMQWSDLLKMIILVGSSGNKDQDSEADCEPLTEAFCSKLHG